MQPNPEAAPCQCRCRCKPQLRSSTALALALGMGAMSLGGAVMVAALATPAVANACAANPCAACGPCAPCAAMDCAACAPCGVCGPCGPCAAGAGDATGCYIPRLQEAAANPCAADPCGPCAPAACAPCAADPCAANPCAADPCAANACAANPCAVCDPCAPCAAMDCAACGPCAAACGACGPCGPCAAAAPPPDVSDEELQALYECMIEMTEAMEASGAAQPILASWSESDRSESADFARWRNFAATPYISFTHGERFATNHANPVAAQVYGLYEDVGEMPAGGIVAKPTFSIGDDGQAYWETLFLMEKAEAGTSPDTNDWLYTAIMPDGSLMGRTLGENSDGMFFCAACHMGMSDNTDDLLFMEEQYRLPN